MAEPSSIIHTAMNALIWEAAIMLICIGCVDLGLGKNEPRDLGIVLLAGAFLESISLGLVILSGGTLEATIAGAFILVLWYLGGAFALGKTNRTVMIHGNMLTGLLFLLLTIFVGKQAEVILAIGLGLLVPVLWAGGIAHYAEKPGIAKIAGVCSFVDAFVFLAMAFTGAIGVALP